MYVVTVWLHAVVNAVLQSPTPSSNHTRWYKVYGSGVNDVPVLSVLSSTSLHLHILQKGIAFLTTTISSAKPV